MSRQLSGGGLLALALITLLPLTTLAATTAKPAGSDAQHAIGVVSMDKITNGYIGCIKAQTRFQAFIKVREDILKTLEQGVGLNTEQFDDYIQHAGQKVQMDPEHINKLAESAKKTMAEYKALQDKENKTDAEKARFNDLDKIIKSDYASLKDKSDGYDVELQTEGERYRTTLTSLMDKAISKIAESHKLAVVLSRDIRSKDGQEKSVLWGGTDISDDVIKELNDTFKESLLDAQPETTTTPAATGPAAPAPAKK